MCVLQTSFCMGFAPLNASLIDSLFWPPELFYEIKNVKRARCYLTRAAIKGQLTQDFFFHKNVLSTYICKFQGNITIPLPKLGAQ